MTKVDDAISRQAAIDAITTWDKFGVDERSRIVTWHEGLEPYVHLRDVVTAIVNLPSAQPYTDAEIQKMQDLYQAEIDKAFELGQEDARSEVIHCGECRYFTTKGNIERVEFGKCSVIKSICLREDYCSWAERKEGETNGM